MPAVYEPGLQVQLAPEQQKVILVMADHTGWIKQGFSPEKAEQIARQLQGAAKAIREGRTLVWCMAEGCEETVDAPGSLCQAHLGERYEDLAREGRLVCPECLT